MPEMPEIETIRRSLEPHIRGRKIENVEVLLARQIKWPEPEAFVARILQEDIVGLERIGKYLLLQLSNQVSLIFHLRMTGQLVYVAAGAADASHHNRVIIYLDDGARLVFSDTCTFGTLYAMHQDELWRIRGMAEMGPEPLSEKFTPEYLAALEATAKLCRVSKYQIYTVEGLVEKIQEKLDRMPQEEREKLPAFTAFFETCEV